ncbi:MAG: DUF2306 domain-containing protein [Ahrensia sp.]|nr:DUF2306 domain-containing protein [Ahrensia sp.]
MIDITPLLNASLAIQVHVASALAAALLGIFVLWRRKGGWLHKINGRVWVALMAVASASSFFIHEIRLWGPFSPIHLLSVWVLFISLPLAVYLARRGKITRHKRVMQGTFIGGIVLAGGFAFLPGRLMHEVVFGAGQYSSPPFGWALSIAAALAIFLFLWWLDRKPGSGKGTGFRLEDARQN